VIDLKDSTQQLPNGLTVTVQFLSNGPLKKLRMTVTSVRADVLCKTDAEGYDQI